MIFKPIEEEGKSFISNLKSTLTLGLGNIENIFKTFNGGLDFSFSKEFLLRVQNDLEVLNRYIKANADERTEIIKSGSQELKNYINNTEFSKLSNEQYQNIANQQQITLMASSKSLSQVSSLLKEYNTGCKTCGLSTKEFTTAVSQGNAGLGNYLTKLNGAKASMQGYISSLVSAKAATIGLQIASTALNMAITMGVAFAIQGLIKLADELIVTSKEAIEAGENAKSTINEIQNNFKDASKTVEDYADRFAKLSQGVDTLSGKNLTLNDDDYQEFLDISNQLAETFPTLSRHYDENGNAIVQLNGDAETITGTLQNLLETERQLANQKIVDNLPDLFKGIKTKSKQYDKEIKKLNILTYNSNDLNNNEYLEVDKAIRNIFEKYGVMYSRENNEATGEVNWKLDGGQATIENFKNNQSQINQEIENYFQGITTEYEIASKQAINSIENENKANWSGLISSISAYLSTNDTYNVLSDEAQSALQNVINNLDYGALDFSNWEQLKDFIDENLLDLFSNNDTAENNEIIKFLDIQTQFNGNQCSISEYQNALNTVKTYVDSIKDEKTKKQITLALNLDNDISNNQYKSLKEQFKDKGEDFSNWVDGLSKQELQIATDVDFDTAEWNLNQWENYVRGQYQVDMAISFDYDQAKEDLKTINEALSEMNTGTGLSASSKSNIANIFGSLESYDAESLFERTANGIKINYNELRRLRAEQETINKENFAESLVTLNKEYEDLTTQIHNATSAEERNQLIEKQNDIANKINKVSDLASQYDGLTSAYQAWIDAQSAGESGDMYDKIRSGLENIKKLYDEGLVGTEEFRSYVDLLSGEDLSTATIDEIVAAYERLNEKIKGTSYNANDFLKEGSTGVENFLKAINQINSEWASVDANGNWTLHFDNQAIADSLGVDIEFIESMIQKLKDYGFEIDIDATENSTKTLKELKTTAKEANEELKTLSSLNYDIDINFSSNDPDYINTKIGEVEEKLSLFNRNADGTINLKQEGAEEIQIVLATLIRQKQSLEQPWIMQLDLSGVENDTATIISTVQELQTALEQLQVNQKVGADTTEAQKQVQNLVNKINELDPDGEITKQINFNTDDAQAALDEIQNADVNVNASISENSVNNLLTTINGINSEMVVKAGIDDSIVAQYDPDSKYNKKAKVNYEVNDSKVKGWKPPQKDGTVWYTVKAKGTTKVKIVASEAMGTAHATGSAFAHGSTGNWSIGTNGISLGGELGEELLVRNGRFYTIGKDSPEFFKHQKNDIIFNAAQTEQIFKYGKIISGKKRGTAYGSTGLAFATGSGNFGVGGSGSSSNQSSSSSSSKSSTKSSSSSNDNNEDKKDIWDWIEIKIARLEREIKKFDKIVKNTYKSFTVRNQNAAYEINKITSEIYSLNNAYKRYIDEANSVNLSADLKRRVRDGNISINEYDKDTAELIKQYQEWYEKALDCKDSIDDLNESVSDLYKTIFDNKIAEFEGALGQLENKANLINAYIDKAELMGYRADSTYYTELINLENKNINQLKKEKTALINELNKAVNDVVITVNSEAWYEMQEEIDTVTQKIVESENAILEYSNTIREISWDNFDYIQNIVSQLTDESDFLIDVMSKSNMYNKNGSITNEGQATMGLHGLNYNVYMEQSLAYAREIENINKQIAENPYDTKLLERKQKLLETQREMILAAENEKQAIRDMVEEGINYELDALQELINKYTDALDKQKDLYDYQKNIEEQTKNIASLQKQLLVYNQNTSDEGRLKRQQLNNSLNEAQEKLQETEYERYISDQKKLLDEMYDEYSEILNMRLDNIDVLVQNCIDSINDNSSTINTTISEIGNDVGYALSEDMKKIWSGSDNQVLKDYSQAFNTYTDDWNKYSVSTSTHLTNLQTRLGDINTNIGKLLAKYNITAQDSVNKATDNSSKATGNQSQSNSTSTSNKTNTSSSSSSSKYTFWINKKDSYPKSKLNISRSIVDRLKYHDYDSSMSARAKYYQGMGLGSSSSYKSTANQNISMLNWMKSHGYKNGVYDLPYGEFAWTNENHIPETIIRPSDNAILTPLKRHDSVLNGNATANIWNMANNPEKFIKDNINNEFTFGNINNPNSNSSIHNTIDLEIILPNVQNYNELLSSMQNDTRFEKLVQTITLGRLSGKSKFDKYTIK